METFADIPIMAFEHEHDWLSWLDKNYTDQRGVWLKIAKKATGIPTVTYAEALDHALCYGWIDGQKRSYDESYFLQKFTPRRARSIWSKVNVAKVAALIEAGRMKPSGQAAIEAAKQNGQWDQAYDSPANSVISPDFQSELDQNPKAKAFFATLTKSQQYSYTWRIQTAKREATRQARIQKFIMMLNNGEKLN